MSTGALVLRFGPLSERAWAALREGTCVATCPGMRQEPPIGPVTKNAVLGVIFGLTSGSLYAAMVESITVTQGAFGGFVGGLVGGTVWGLIAGRRETPTPV